MTEVEFKIFEMQEATERFRRSGQRVDLSMQRIHALITPILPHLDPGLVLQYQTQSTTIEELILLLREFTEKLEQASHDLQGALDKTGDLALHHPERNTPISADASFIYASADGYTGARPVTDTGDTGPVNPEDLETPVDIDAYVSANNRHLYDRLVNNQVLLSSREFHLEELVENRETLVEDLDALRNRMSSYNSNMDVDSVPRVQALQHQIDQIDQRIVDTRETIEQLQIDISDIRERLERVAPGAGADFSVISTLENGETAEIVTNNTYGCVNHVVSRVPIPMEMARDAHMWDDMAQRYTEYGIRIGDVPLEGGLIVMETDHSFADDINGHLMYIERIDENGDVWITDNYHPDTPVRLSDLTDELDGPNIHYLYLPWHTRA